MKFFRKRGLLNITILLFWIGLVVIYVATHDMATLISFIAFMYVLLKGIENNIVSSRPREVEIVKVGENEHLNFKINRRIVDLQRKKKLVINVEILNERKGVIHYQ